MIALCTGGPEVRREGDRIIATVPSGGSVIEIALNYGQATQLGQIMVRVARDAIHSQNVSASAEVVNLRRSKRRKD